MPHRRILIVEDDPDAQSVVAHIMGYLKLQIDLTGTAEQALELIFRAPQSYAAVMVDLALPGKDGWALLKEIQGNVATAQIPCIAMTAYHSSKLRHDVLQSGFVAYFPKPIDAAQLIEYLKTYI